MKIDILAVFRNGSARFGSIRIKVRCRLIYNPLKFRDRTLKMVGFGHIVLFAAELKFLALDPSGVLAFDGNRINIIMTSFFTVRLVDQVSVSWVLSGLGDYFRFRGCVVDMNSFF